MKCTRHANCLTRKVLYAAFIRFERFLLIMPENTCCIHKCVKANVEMSGTREGSDMCWSFVERALSLVFFLAVATSKW